MDTVHPALLLFSNRLCCVLRCVLVLVNNAFLSNVEWNKTVNYDEKWTAVACFTLSIFPSIDEISESFWHVSMLPEYEAKLGNQDTSQKTNNHRFVKSGVSVSND